MPEATLFKKLDAFFASFSLLRYKKRALVPNLNGTISHVFYLKSGFARVYRLSEQGEELTLSILKPHDIFPLTYGINEVITPYYLEAITNLEMWQAPSYEFQAFLKKEAEIYFELTNKILIRFDGMLNRIEYLVFSSAYIKVAATLLSCAKRFGKERKDKIFLELPLTHKDIAAMVGITRETTSIEMKKLEKQGFITREGKKLILNNPRLLEASVLTPGKNKQPLPLYSF